MDWQKTEWITSNVTTYELDICKEKEDKWVIFPIKANFEDSFYRCKKLGGDLAAPNSEEMYNSILKLFNEQITVRTQQKTLSY